MPKTIYCPYYHKETIDVIYCECGKIKFRSGKAKCLYIRAYCGGISQYPKCTLAKARTEYYEKEGENLAK